MLLLAADTSGKQGSIALARCGPGTVCNVLEIVPLAGGTFSAQLIPQIAALLEKHHLIRSGLAAFAVASGPGSFTGLRVGLSAIKALAEVLNKPIAMVSLLEVVARSGHANGPVIAALDAGRGEIYCGEYEITDIAKMISERLLSQEEFLADAARLAVITSDSNIADIARTHKLRVEQINRPDSGDIARWGWEKISIGQVTPPEALDANYIRRSDSEIFAKMKNL